MATPSVHRGNGALATVTPVPALKSRISSEKDTMSTHTTSERTTGISKGSGSLGCRQQDNILSGYCHLVRERVSRPSAEAVYAVPELQAMRSHLTRKAQRSGRRLLIINKHSSIRLQYYQ